jgi:hypothetical protein
MASFNMALVFMFFTVHGFMPFAIPSHGILPQDVVRFFERICLHLSYFIWVGEVRFIRRLHFFTGLDFIYVDLSYHAQGVFASFYPHILAY